MIYPRGFTKPPVKAYCDLSRDGGGWTLLVTSRTNTWTAQNVRSRNQDSPSLQNDYSLLQYADDIKNSLNVIGNTFEYRLEAQNPGWYLSALVTDFFSAYMNYLLTNHSWVIGLKTSVELVNGKTSRKEKYLLAH